MRLHPSIILEKLISSLVFIVLLGYYIVINGLDDLKSENIKAIINTDNLNILLIGLIVIFILLIIFTIIFWIIWKNTYITLKKDSLVIERGKLFKKVTTIHLKDIATVNIRVNILERILGTANIKIDLHNTEGEIYKGKLVFKAIEAEQIKDKLLRQNPKTKNENEIKSLIKYTDHDVFKHMLLSIDIVSISIILIAYLTVLYMLITHNGIHSGIIITVLLIILVSPLAISFFKTYLSYYGFKCSREKNNIRLSYGALTNYKYSIPISRINGIIIRQSLQARILGYYLIEVINAGIGGTDEKEKTIISLYVNEKNKNKILKKIIPEFSNNINLKTGEEESLKHYILAKLFWMILGICIAPFNNCLSLLLIPILLIVAFIQYKTNKIGYNKKMVILMNGLINKRTILIKYENIELIAGEKTVFGSVYATKRLIMQVVGPTNNNVFTSGIFDEKLINDIINVY